MNFQHLNQVKGVADARHRELLREANSLRLLRLVKHSRRSQVSRDVITARSAKTTWKRTVA